MKDGNDKVVKWYSSGNIITNLIITCILVIIVVSQSFALGDISSLAVFGSIINHNSIYLLILIYFIILKFKFGKRYFNYLNVFLIFIYAISTLTSFLTIIQSFSLNSVLTFILNCSFLIYLFHTLFRDTRVWKDYKLSNSPFNEIGNDSFFYAIIVVSFFLLAVNLISTVVVSGVILSTLDTIYYILLGRYIYLYRDYLDSNKLDANNSGNFNSVRDKVQDVLDKTDIDEKIIDVKDKIVDTAKDVKDKVKDYAEENKLDEKFDDIKEKTVDTVKNAKDKVESVLSNDKDDVNGNTSKKENKNKTSKKKGDK